MSVCGVCAFESEREWVRVCVLERRRKGRGGGRMGEGWKGSPRIVRTTTENPPSNYMASYSGGSQIYGHPFFFDRLWLSDYNREKACSRCIVISFLFRPLSSSSSASSFVESAWISLVVDSRHYILLYFYFIFIIFCCFISVCSIVSHFVGDVDTARITNADVANFVENFDRKVCVLCAAQDINCLKPFNRKWLIRFHMV